MAKGSSKNRRGNLGATRQRMKRRSKDPMDTYDACPAPLRLWLSSAALPWSPASAQRVWRKALAGGADTEGALALLSDVEEQRLSKETLPGSYRP